MIMTHLILAFIIFLDFLMLHNCMINRIKEIMRRRLPIYAMLSKTYLLNLIKCGKELKDLQEAINQQLLWSLKVCESYKKY
ncbi:hypothetical protein HZH68_000864 [Vespula germanica]|uniref:Uncharacterized protein n=1 Tax=Vespula germanica TaxID=30212 RepID=A0A834NUF1_VESGE|nr:hypothetical protein HZH68_000864 [Vespula germanica]